MTRNKLPPPPRPPPPPRRSSRAEPSRPTCRPTSGGRPAVSIQSCSLHQPKLGHNCHRRAALIRPEVSRPAGRAKSGLRRASRAPRALQVKARELWSFGWAGSRAGREASEGTGFGGGISGDTRASVVTFLRQLRRPLRQVAGLRAPDRLRKYLARRLLVCLPACSAACLSCGRKLGWCDFLVALSIFKVSRSRCCWPNEY